MAIDSQRALRSSARPASRHSILNDVFQAWHNLREECCLEFQGIDSQLAGEVCQSLQKGDLEGKNSIFTYNANLREIRIVLMTSGIHDCHQSWYMHGEFAHMITNGFLTPDESQNLVGTVGTIFDNFGGIYANSRKQPDFCTYPNTLRFPTIVIESGWSESRPALEQDADLWLKGGQGRLELAIILKWTKITGQKVKGDVTVYNLDAGGNARKLQNEQVFPASPNSAGQTIPITRGQLYGSAPVPAGRSGTDVWQFSIDRLRTAARSAIEREGYIPANREKLPLSADLAE